MKIIFMGTPEFAVASLAELIKNNYNVVGVITAPDKPAGRGQQLQQSAVKLFALKNNLKILQPENLKSEIFLQELRSLNADIQIVVAFRMLPEVVWNMPKHGTYNLHASLLPKYRGAAPINWAIINGEKISGVTTFKLKHEIDTGNILFQEKVEIEEEETAGSLHDKLMNKGKHLIIKTVEEVNKCFTNNIALNFITQDDSVACHAPKLFKENCKIDFKLNAQSVHNLVRGLSPYPAAYTNIVNEGKTQQLKIFSSKVEETGKTGKPGSIYSDGKTYFKIQCERNVLTVYELQLEGKKKMTTSDFLRGYKLNSDSHCI